MPLRKNNNSLNSYFNMIKIQLISLSTSNYSLKIFRKVQHSHKNSSEVPAYTCRKRRKYFEARASFTLEAAVVVPLAACFLVSILFYFRILQSERRVETALQYTGRQLAAAAFSENYGIDISENKLAGVAAAKVMLDKCLCDQNEDGKYIVGGLTGISLLESEVDGNFEDLKAVYAVKLPIAVFGEKVFPVCQEVKARKWSGYSENGDCEGNEVFVYITPEGTVYHRDRYCSYLDLSIKSISSGEIKNSRNNGGGTYTACEFCGKKKPGCAIYYITDYGDRFHTELTCSGLKRSVNMVRLSEAEEAGRTSCSKCGGM